MKTIIICASFFVGATAWGAPCGGALGQFYSNPDGSLGGYVQKTAQVANTVFIDSSSEVCGRSVLRGSVRIEAGSRIEENVTIEGSAKIIDSHVFGYAKIYGGAIVQGATVCQTSLIEGIKVINSDYYCQTEDPSPKDPGEDGRKTLLGIDTDGDGVRDDIEVFINNQLSNTAKQNKAQERIATKSYAKLLQREIISRENPEEIDRINSIKTDLIGCNEMSISKKVFINSYDTKERLFSMFKIAGYMHGKAVKQPTSKCKKIPLHDGAI